MVELKCKQKRTSAFQMESGSLFSKYPGIYGLIFFGDVQDEGMGTFGITRTFYMKNLLIALLLIWTSLNAEAQDSLESKRIHLGISVTPAIGFIESWSDSDQELKSSFSVTAEGNLIFQRHLLWGWEIGFSFQKASLRQIDCSPNFPMDFMNGELNYCLSYYEYKAEYLAVGLPVRLQYKLSKKANHFFLSGGAHFKQIVNSKEKLVLIESGIVFHSLSTSQNDLELNKTQLFLSLGFGYDFVLNSGSRISVGPSILQSTSNFLKVNESTSSPGFVGGKPLLVGFRILYYGTGA